MAGSTVDITLGGSNTAGLEIVNGALTELDAAVTSNIVLGGLTITTNALTFEYDSSDATYEVSGTASFALAGFDGRYHAGGQQHGRSRNCQRCTHRTGCIGDVEYHAGRSDNHDQCPDVRVRFQRRDLRSVGHGNICAGGLDGRYHAGRQQHRGLEIVNGALTELNASVTSNIVLGGLTIATKALTFEYDSSDATYEVSGTASFALAGSTVDITLGGSNTAGLEIVNGALTELDASVTSNIELGGLTITTNALTFEYDSSDARYEVSGTATFALAGSTVDITLGGSDTAGLEIVNGALTELDASVTSNITIASLTIATKALTFEYEAADSSFEVSGTASFSLAGSTVSITLGNGSTTNPGGLVIEGGQLESLDASVTGGFDLLGIDLQANGLGLDYWRPRTAEFALVRRRVDDQQLPQFQHDARHRARPGNSHRGGSARVPRYHRQRRLLAVWYPGHANGLTIQYCQCTNELELSGGIMLDFTSAFEVSAAISQGGLFINTATGALSVAVERTADHRQRHPGTVLHSEPDDLLQHGPGGVNFSASGEVDLPGGIDVDLTSSDIVNGQLADIGLLGEYSDPDRRYRLLLDSLSGSLDNLNNIVAARGVAPAPRSRSARKSRFPAWDRSSRGGYVLAGRRHRQHHRQRQPARPERVGELAGRLARPGSASLDLNWTTGIYMVTGNFSMYDDIFNFGGSLTITNAAISRYEAMASVNVPPQIPFIGGDSLGSINFFLQYEPGQPLTQDFVAAWTSVNLFFFSFTIGFEIDFQGDVSVINGNDVAGADRRTQRRRSHAVRLPEPVLRCPAQRYRVPTGAQISVTSPIFDGDYPPPTRHNWLERIFRGRRVIGLHQFLSAESDIIMSTLEFHSHGR